MALSNISREFDNLPVLSLFEYLYLRLGRAHEAGLACVMKNARVAWGISDTIYQCIDGVLG